jgi:subtilisin family serine protease
MARFVLPKHRDYIVVELKYETPVVAEQKNARFVGKDEGEQDAEKLNGVIAKFGILGVRNQFPLRPKAVRQSLEVATKLPDIPMASAVARKIATVTKKDLDVSSFFKSNFVAVVPKNAADAKKIASALKKQPAVWDAYPAPYPVPPLYVQLPDIAEPGSFNLEPTQGYLYSAPYGIGAMDAWEYAGGKGDGVSICDVEYAWNLDHEDLPRTIKRLGGTPLTQNDFVNHGTAVLGEMVAVPNAFGAVGISHEAKAFVQSAMTDNNVYDLAWAIDNAASKLSAGDVMLIEQHSELNPGKGDFVAMQYWSAIFTAIQAAVNKGIVVVEAAGNGSQNFDAAGFNGSYLQKDCGAIVVGAGVPPTNRVDFNGFGQAYPGYSSLGVPRSRIFFSNYGKIVNLQGWGWHVSSTGYGDAQDGADPNKFYTFRFSGTSSASPIVTGAVACLQGAARAKVGRPLTPDRVRKLLVDTGTLQEDSPGVAVASNHIGPQPNLVAAIKRLQ